MRPKPIKPKAGQESVWDYPRPPRVEAASKHVRVVFNGEIIVDTNRALRVLETSHPPVYYLPFEGVKMEYFQELDPRRDTYCEFKGMARYFDLRVGEQSSPAVAWTYPSPVRGFESLKGHLALYPGRMEACYLNDERVQAQAGDFYGGWITEDIVGPFKGGAGTWGW
ncbi:MAG: DUF427 domain-containing protein [Bacteroidota bacterium]